MEVLKGDKASPLMNESDEDLLVIISMKDDIDSSNLGFEEFHRRFKRFIYGMAIKVTSNLPNSDELRDAVFQNTLINVHKYCDSFSNEGESDPEIVKRKIHGWLAKIAKNELLSLLRGQESIVDPEELNNAVSGEDKVNDEEVSDELSYNEQIVGEALKLLKDRDQHVFMTYWLYYEMGGGSQAKNLPTEVLEELAAKYETTPENIRQIISRSKKKVFEYLETNYRLNRR